MAGISFWQLHLDLIRKFLVTLAWFGLLLLLGVPLFAQSFLPQTPLSALFHPDDYKAGSQNWDIAQDKRGFIYFANHFGLLEFDGSQWKTYSTKLGASLKSVCVGENGNIYVGGQGNFGYFKPTLDGRLIYHSLDSLLEDDQRSFDELWHIYENGDEKYFCSRKYIFLLKEGSLKVISHPGIQYSYFLNYKLYVSTWNDGLLVLNNDSLHQVKGGELFRGKSIRGMIPLNQSKILIATLDGDLYSFSEEGFVEFGSKNSSLFKESLINSVLRLRSGEIAIGTQNNGLYILNQEGKIVQNLDKDNGLCGHTIFALHEDELGNLWLGQSNGISYVFLGLPFSQINDQQGVEGAGYAATIYKDKAFLGTSNGAFIETKDGFKKIKGSSGQVYQFSVQKEKLLMGHHNGTFEYQEGEFKKIDATQGSWMFERKNDDRNILLSGHYQGLKRFEWQENEWSKGTVIKNFKESSRLFFMDESGYIWVSHGFKGVFRLSLNENADSVLSQQFYGASSGFPSDELINVFKLQNRLLFGTINGPYSYDPLHDNFRPDSILASKIGQESRLIDLSEDVNGNLYYLKTGEIGYLQKMPSGKFYKPEIPFDLISPFVYDDLEKIIPIDLNTVLISAREGFLLFDPTKKVSQLDSLQIYLREVRSMQGDSTLFPYGAASKIPGSKHIYKFAYSNRFITLRVSSAPKHALAGVKYRYLIKDLDPEWTPWTEQTIREVNGLSPGAHEVWVEAQSNGKYKRAFLAILYVYPPWYLSWWARLAYSILFILVLMGLGWFLWRRFILLEYKLKEDRDKAIKDKEKEMEEISLRSENEIQKIKQEKLESELTFKNQELASSTMHLLAKNAFLQNLKENLEKIPKAKPQELGKLNQSIKKIIQRIDQNLNDEDEWERFSFHFSQVHGDFFGKLKAECPELSPQELKLCAYLRLNMSTKEIAQLLNISIRGVETGRYRLRKKLNLDTSINLVDYMMKV
ncbi:MAG: hypothetical protein AAFY71_25155 [Bacteroidota bacterium]